MFNKSASQPTTEPARKSAPARSGMTAPSILGNDLVITGEINTDGDVQIEGRLEGNVKAATLTIGEQGIVNGSITAGSVYIRGKVTGKIDATIVEILETANVLADIKHEQISISNGAFFDGKCKRKTKSSSTPSVTQTKITKK